MKYKINDEQDRQRLAEFDHYDPANLEDDLKLASLQLEKAINANNQGAAATWMQIKQRLSKTYEDTLIRKHEIITKAGMVRLCNRLIDLIAEDYRSAGVENWDARLQGLVGQMGRMIEVTKNTSEEVKAIT